jgi:G3E family GTPase
MAHGARDSLLEQPAIPLTILTGFLGAGKTTLLNRILQSDHGLRVAVLVNDFGSVNVDADLVVGVASDVISLANGCICCTIRDDLVATVLETLDRPERPEYVVLEASGVAEPSGIMVTFAQPGLRDRLRLDIVVCVVDAEQVFAVPELMELKLWQVGCADLIILNKVDLVDRAQLDRVRAWLDEHLWRYRLVEASHCDVPLEILLSVGQYDAARVDLGAAGSHEHSSANDHAQAFSTWTYETDRPLRLVALKAAAAKLPVTVYRAKGVVYAADAPERRAVLQVVGKRVDLTLHDAWDARTPHTQIAAIGARGGVDPRTLQETFDACIQESAVGAGP